MKCRECGQEVLLAERCPYCGHPTGVRMAAGGQATGPADSSGTEGGAGQAGSSASQARPGERPRGRIGSVGRFVGPMRGGADRGAGDGWAGVNGFGGVRGGLGGGLGSHGRGGPAAHLSAGDWVRRLVAYILDPRVPTWKKGLIAAGLMYLVFPLDLISDVFPLLGWTDDLVLLWFGIRALTGELRRYVPPSGRLGGPPGGEAAG